MAGRGETFARLRERNVEFTQETIARYGPVDAGFRDLSGSGSKMVTSRRLIDSAEWLRRLADIIDRE